MSSNSENNNQNNVHLQLQQQHQPSPQQAQQRKEISIEPQQSKPKGDLLDVSNPHMQEQQNIQLSNNLDDIKPLEEQRINQQNSMELNSRIQNHQKNNTLYSGNQKPISCHCKKSKCLKMYCQCYAKGNKCRDTCKCIGCENTKNMVKDKKSDCLNDEEIDRSQDSNKKSLKPKERSCNCKKSFCLKKYCQCFNANQACGQACKCQDCKNNGQNNNFRQDKNQQSVPIIDNTFYPLTINKEISQAPSELNDKKQDPPCPKRRQKLDQDEIETKISQIMKLVPQQNYQTMLDFLAYYLS